MSSDIWVAIIAAIPVVLTVLVAAWRTNRTVTNGVLEGISKIAEALHAHVEWEERQKYDEIERKLTHLERMMGEERRQP